MKTEKIVEKTLVKKPSGVKTILEYNNNKYKTRSQLIMEQYEQPTITEDKIYLIDKVVRQRCKNGRFGVDHSEILNYELELANKDRDEHMNHLVYKTKNPYGEYMQDENQEPSLNPPGGAIDTSQVLFKRLSNKGPISNSSRMSLLESGRKSSIRKSVHTDRSAPSFQQWVRSKDAEKRLKKKLMNEQKREIR